MTPTSRARRRFLQGAALAGGAAALAGSARAAEHLAHHAPRGHGGNMTVGPVSTSDFDPYAYATRFDWGREVGDLGNGAKVREYDVEAVDKVIEIAPGVFFNAWTFNGQVPGPTLRAREGDKLRIRFRNNGTHPHTMHFHGIHSAIMDGIPDIGPGQIPPGGAFTYEFDADPHGVHLYHCHAVPLKRHIHKGLYGAYIVDPKDGWGDEAENEFVFMLNSFDTNFDNENEIYAVNTKAFAYVHRPLRITKDRLQRAFVINITEFDALNSFHLHGNFFHYVENGHKSNPRRFTDNVAIIQGERGLMEFTYKFPGRFMFHAHQSELAELGWTGMFEVVE
ncbi:MAG TPA: multicopper oxidase domain-containing protein [Candidatus Thermoplasmatota archaeon]|nr:multicopper oxidase domain-containing protein [Candidatus Thermoplasmatota archaeon]